MRLISLVGTSGNTYTVEVLERRYLDLQIPQVPEDIARRWQGRGIHPVSDIAQEKIEQAVDVLIGADYADIFLKKKMEVDWEVAHRTMFGWVLSGPAKLRDDKQPGELVNVQRVADDIQVL